MLRPVAFHVAVPGQHLHGHPKVLADLCELMAAPLDILPFDALLFTWDALLLPVFPVSFAVPAFLVVVAPADRLQQLVHIVGLIHEFRAQKFHLLEKRGKVRILVGPWDAAEGPAG